MAPYHRDMGRCQAYTERSVPLARGGRRHMRCQHTATEERLTTRVTAAWRETHQVELCGLHARMLDKGHSPRLQSDERGQGR